LRHYLFLAFLGFSICGAGALHAQANPPSLVNVTDARFGATCGGAADATGHRDATCAIRAAFAFAGASGLPGGGYPVLYFPHGVYKVAGEGYGSALTLTKSISIQGDGAASTVILNTSPTAVTLTYLKAQDCSGNPGLCPLTVQGLTFAGLGQTTAGGLIEIDSTPIGYMRNVAIAHDGGIGLNLQGSSERWHFEDMEISNVRWPVLLEGDTNEDYFDRVNVIDGGMAGSYCYSVNCPGGKRIEKGIWLPDPHSAVFLDGDNVHWINSSIKGTASIGGIRMAPTTSSLMHTYIEGYPWGGQPRSNHAVAAPGKMEIGHLTAAISAASLDIPVDDAGWQPLYTNDPAQARVNDVHSYTNTYGIFPADYLPKSTEPSRTTPGITRGTMEIVQMASFGGDGNAHLLHRGNVPVAWPAGSIIEQQPPNGYGTIRLEENHLNSVVSATQGPFTSGCNDTTQRARWTSSASELCAEVIAGLVPDGYMVPFPTQDYVHQTFELNIVDNSIYTGGVEQDGSGWIKVPGDATVRIDQGNEPLRNFADAETAMHSYSNGVTHVQVVTYPGGPRPASALAYVEDASAGVRFSPQDRFFAADVVRDGAVQHQASGQPCWYGIQSGNAAPGQRTCLGGAVAAQAPSPQLGAPVKFVIRDWQVNLLAPRGQQGDCQSRDAATANVHFSTGGDSTLIVNLQPNPEAMVTATGAIGSDGSHVSVRLCNTGSTPVRWTGPTVVTLTQLP
jgi:hypothetical protein